MKVQNNGDTISINGIKDLGASNANSFRDQVRASMTDAHKYIEIDLAPGTDPSAAQAALNDAAHKFLSNPIIEDYRLEME